MEQPGVSHSAQAVLGSFRLSGQKLRGPWQTLAARWRGAVAGVFPADPAFHGHEGERQLYRYPPVQYRWIDNSPVLFVLGAPMEVAMNHGWPGTHVRLGGEEREILDVEWHPLPLRIETSNRLLRYSFGAPWLALNQENHARYRALDPEGRRAELDRILVGNLLSAFTGLGLQLPIGATIFASVEKPRPRSYVLKGVDLLGFDADFVCNFSLPAGLALGRSVSHGFGWITVTGSLPHSF
jgi:hypothetical protein